MLKDNKMCYNDGEEVKIGDIISVNVAPDKWVILQLDEAVVGQQVVMTPQGQQVLEILLLTLQESREYLP